MQPESTALSDLIFRRAWALEPTVLQRMSQIVSRHLSGAKLSREEIDAVVAARGVRGEERAYEVRDGVAVVPVQGVISKHARAVGQISQPRGTSTTAVAAAIDQALADESVGSILLHVDSPGGSVDGVAELANKIHAARGRKPITALADGMMASAAYWIGSQADRVLVSPSAEVGSIGVYSVAEDYSRMAANEGVAVHVIRSGAHKGAHITGAQITPEHIRGMQEVVDAYAGLFHDAVGRGRDLDAEAVAKVATGQTWVGAEAVKQGLADGVATLDEIVAALRPKDQGKRVAATSAAAATPTEPAAPTVSAKAQAMDNAKTVQAAASPPDPAPTSATTNTATNATVYTVTGHLPDSAKLLAEGAKAERERAAAIRAEAAAEQHELAEKLVADGTSLVEARAKLHADLRERFTARKDAIARETPKAFGHTEQTVESSNDPDAKFKAEFAKDRDLQAIHGTAERYASYQRAVEAGQITRIARKES